MRMDRAATLLSKFKFGEGSVECYVELYYRDGIVFRVSTLEEDLANWDCCQWKSFIEVFGNNLSSMRIVLFPDKNGNPVGLEANFATNENCYDRLVYKKQGTTYEAPLKPLETPKFFTPEGVFSFIDGELVEDKSRSKPVKSDLPLAAV